MKKVLLMLFLITFLVSGTGYAAALEGGVGFIDVEKIMAESPKVKALQEQLNQVAKDYASKLEEDKLNLTEEQFKQKQEAYYGDFLQIKKQLESQVDASLKQALEQIATEKKLVVVLYKNSVAFGGIDITLDVIAKMK